MLASNLEASRSEKEGRGRAAGRGGGKAQRSKSGKRAGKPQTSRRNGEDRSWQTGGSQENGNGGAPELGRAMKAAHGDDTKHDGRTSNANERGLREEDAGRCWSWAQHRAHRRHGRTVFPACSTLRAAQDAVSDRDAHAKLRLKPVQRSSRYYR